MYWSVVWCSGGCSWKCYKTVTFCSLAPAARSDIFRDNCATINRSCLKFRWKFWIWSVVSLYVCPCNSEISQNFGYIYIYYAYIYTVNLYYTYILYSLVGAYHPQLTQLCYQGQIHALQETWIAWNPLACPAQDRVENHFKNGHNLGV